MKHSKISHYSKFTNVEQKLKNASRQLVNADSTPQRKMLWLHWPGNIKQSKKSDKRAQTNIKYNKHNHVEILQQPTNQLKNNHVEIRQPPANKTNVNLETWQVPNNEKLIMWTCPTTPGDEQWSAQQNNKKKNHKHTTPKTPDNLKILKLRIPAMWKSTLDEQTMITKLMKRVKIIKHYTKYKLMKQMEKFKNNEQTQHLLYHLQHNARFRAGMKCHHLQNTKIGTYDFSLIFTQTLTHHTNHGHNACTRQLASPSNCCTTPLCGIQATA